MTKPRQPLRTAPVVCPRDAYPPTNISEKELNDRSRRTVELFGRLAPGVSVSAARAEFDAISKRLQSAYPAANKNRAAFVEPYSALGAGGLPAGMFARLFLVVGALALLIVCANTANLMLSRAVLRQREMAVRQTLGASRGRIFRMLLAEGLAISFTAFLKVKA